MGKPYPEENEDINKVREVVQSCPGLCRYLSHHIRNGLMGIWSGEVSGDLKKIEDFRLHIQSDLERVGL